MGQRVAGPLLLPPSSPPSASSARGGGGGATCGRTLFVAPAALLIGLVFLYPIVQVIRYSFYAGSTSE